MLSRTALRTGACFLCWKDLEAASEIIYVVTSHTRTETTLLYWVTVFSFSIL